MSRIVIIDRILTNEEQKRLHNDDHVIDLTQSDYHSSVYKDEIIQWIDSSYDMRINEQSIHDFFSVSGHSYWYHVRFRIFYKMFEQAQLLDRIEEAESIKKTDLIFCDYSKRDFWQRWASRAEIISPLPSQVKVNTFSVFIKRISFALSKLNETTRILKRTYSGAVFSSIQNSLPKGDKVIDKRLESMLEHSPYPLMKVEYQSLPKLPQGEWFQNFNLPRSVDTIFTDSLLLLFLLLNPSFILSMIKGYFELNRLDSHIKSDHEFSSHNDEWQSLFAHYVGKSKLSILQMFLFEHAFSWMLSQIKPSFSFASGENNSIGRVFIDASRELDIITFGMQHGVLYPNNIDYRFQKEEADKKYPDHFLSWGEASAKFVHDYGNQNKSKVTPVGQSEFDLYAHEVQNSEQVLKFKHDQDRDVIFFASQPQPNQQSRIECARVLASFCKKHNLSCLVKLHPNELNDHLYESFFDNEGIADRLMYIDENIYSIMSAADYVSTCYSTVAMEAMTLCKPVIIIDPLQLDPLGFSELESVHYITHAESDFKKWLELADTHIENAEQLAFYEFGPRDGRCHERIWNKIMKELKKADVA